MKKNRKSRQIPYDFNANVGLGSNSKLLSFPGDCRETEVQLADLSCCETDITVISARWLLSCPIADMARSRSAGRSIFEINLDYPFALIDAGIRWTWQKAD